MEQQSKSLPIEQELPQTINKAFDAMSDAIGNKNIRAWQEFLLQVAKEETDANKHSHDATEPVKTHSFRSKRYAVKIIGQYMDDTLPRPLISDYFGIRRSHYMAYCFTDLYARAINEALHKAFPQVEYPWTVVSILWTKDRMEFES